MSNLLDQMRAAVNPDTIKIPFDPDRTPREQIEAGIASVKPRICKIHPHETLLLDKAATIRSVLFCDYPYCGHEHSMEFAATYERCSRCPHTARDGDIEVERCAVGSLRFCKQYKPRDETGKPLPECSSSAKLQLDVSPRDQFNTWLAGVTEFRCQVSNQLLLRRDVHMKPPFESWTIEPKFEQCLQCRVERLGIPPDEAHASFDNFDVDPPAIAPHVETCRAFSDAMKGVLLLLGNCGTGKTHLAISILREHLRRGRMTPRFIKHRHFVAQHWQAQRPVAFDAEPPESPLTACQEAGLLVYDELTITTDSHKYEDLLLDLFENRIGHFKPTIITANMSRGELEAALGTRLFDRLRRAAFAVLEFGFESKRPSLNADYLNRPKSGGRT